VEHIFLVYLSIKLSKRLIFISSRLIFICTKFTFSTCILYYTVTVSVTITMACHIIFSNRQTDTNWIPCVRLCSLVHYAGTCSCYSVYVTYAININSVADIRVLLRLPLHLGLNKTLWNNLCIMTNRLPRNWFIMSLYSRQFDCCIAVKNEWMNGNVNSLLIVCYIVLSVFLIH